MEPRFPAEWEPHAATWLAWPHNSRDWPGKFAAIPFVFAEIIRHLARRERVEVLVQDAAAEARARRFLDRSGALSDQVRFHLRPTDRIWLRDSGCTFVKAGAALRAVGWSFNAWAKYHDFQRDREVAGFLAGAAGAPLAPGRMGRAPMILEGGSIDGNGRGTLLTTEECLLSDVQARNPGRAREDYERAFRAHLGIRKVIWLGSGIQGDDTHGHVDDISRFVGDATVVTAVEPDPRDPNHAPLAENLRRLKAAVSKPLSLQVLGWLEKELSADDLCEISGMATFPLVPLLTVAIAWQQNLAALAAAKHAGNLPLPMMDHKKVADVLGFAKITELQHRLLPEAPDFLKSAAE